MRAAGARLIITRVTREVGRFLALTGMDRMLEIVDDDAASVEPALIAAV
jgi:anti-anti-sigma regulatory factor